MTDSPVYLHIEPGASLPEGAPFSPFRAVVVVDAEVTPAWQLLVSDWLVRAGCLYMMAWGRNCSSWDDSVDIANLEQFDYKDIPEDRSVMTTWHANGPLSEAFSFCKQHASHPLVPLRYTVILHISERGDEAQVLAMYAKA